MRKVVAWLRSHGGAIGAFSSVLGLLVSLVDYIGLKMVIPDWILPVCFIVLVLAFIDQVAKVRELEKAIDRLSEIVLKTISESLPHVLEGKELPVASMAVLLDRLRDLHPGEDRQIDEMIEKLNKLKR